jgi:hypothetical protein
VPFITLRADQRPHVATTPGGGLIHPLALAAVAVLIVNDHWAKESYANALTGKLSDVAGLLFFPLLLQATIEVVCAATRRSWRPSRGVLVGCALTTAVVFAAINLAPPAAELYRHGLGAMQWPFRALAAAVTGASVPGVIPVQHTLDPTDLVALPFAGVAIWLGWPRTREVLR